MPKGYSLDLRLKIIEKYTQGVHVEVICKMFSIARATCYRFISLQKKQGSVDEKQQARPGHNPKLRPYEYEEFKQFVLDNPGLNAIQLAKKWGRGMTPSSMRKWLKRFKFTRKKNNSITLNAMKTNDRYLKSK